MRIKNTIPLGTLRLVDYIADDSSLQLINANPRVDIITLEPETMGIMNRYSVGIEPHLYSQAAIDDSCIYLPTKVGHILAIDKFSGQILNSINLGSMHIISDLKQKGDKIYTITGIPINTGHNIEFDKYSLSICDTQTGQKEIQSRYFEGNPSFINIDHEEIWIVGGTHLLKFSLEAELLEEINLGITPAYPPLITPTYVICVSREGEVKAYTRSSLTEYASFKTTSCWSAPLDLDQSSEGKGLTWMTEKGICIANIHTKGFRAIGTNRTMSGMSAALNSSTIVGGDREGFLLTFDVNANAIDFLKLADSKLLKPVLVENFLFVVSDSDLHQIEVKNGL